ncbi:HAD family hydrolase [Candidatus Nitrosotenuis cloacae]|uniref:HAD family hydrolase n=1 Tax=Candidatus Nitrosotenuis cloacae TaxID=1603555 RepID=UPI0022824896|nr:HAD family hydrolase [Candidatus Nitrosotenuis cloacae]
MTYQQRHNDVFIDETASEVIPEIDGIIFDCDGVLVDVSKSYDMAIMQTTQYVLERFVGIKSIPITPEIIGGFKETGGFNDEVDVTYASILSLAAAKSLGMDPKQFIFQVIDNADYTGIKSVEKFLNLQNVDISKLKKTLDYPGPHATNPLYMIFDQIFYGPELYERIFGKKSQFAEKGLIENDHVILTKDLIDILKRKFDGKIAIVTGRGKESINYSLKSLLNEFDVKSSVFLEDESKEMAKPNPKPLMLSMDSLGARCCLYVGDSMEDLLMSNGANALGKRVVFCGIYGTNKNPQLKREFFESKKAPIIIKSIDLIPKALNLA